VTRHVLLLTRLMRLWSAFNLIIGLSVSAFAVSAATLVISAGVERPGTEVAALVTAATLALLALSALLWAAAHHLCARALAGHRPWGRSLALALSVFDLLLLPLGTALGLYAIWVLLHDDARRLFVPEVS
jgi:hypothetical protein